MGDRTREMAQADFSGGINAVASPYKVTAKQVRYARNLLLDEHGSLHTRDGYSIVTTGPDTFRPIVYLGAFNKSDQTTIPFGVQNDGTINIVYNTSTTPWTRIGTSGTSYLTPQSVTVTDLEVFAMGYETPWRYDGTTWAQITAAGGQTVPAGARHLSFHLGSLWLWNTFGSDTTYDGPSSLRMSDPNNVNSWPNANQTFVAKNDGQVGMGMTAYTIAETGISPTATLVLFKNLSAYQVTGVFGATNFSVQKIKTDMGCNAPRTIQFVSGFGVIRLTHKGFALYNGVDDRLISEEIRPWIFGHHNVSPIDFSTVDRSWAVQSQNPPLYIAACPTESNQLNRIFVFDLVRRAWTLCDFPIGMSSLVLYTTPTTQPEVRAGAFTGGRIVRLFAGDETDNGTPVPWGVITRVYSFGSPFRPAYWRRAILDLAFTTGQTASVSAILNGIPTPISKSVTYTGTVAGGVYGSAVYGTSVYGASSAEQIDRQESIGIMRTAPSMEVTLSGTGHVMIRGISFHGVPKPLNRLATSGAR